MPNSNLFTHCLLFFSREATSEIYTPRVSSLLYSPSESTFICFYFSDLLNQKYKNTLLQFILIYFISRSRAIYLSNYYNSLTSICQFSGAVTRKVYIENPFNTSGCEYFLFVCRSCLRGVSWFSYWFDNLGLITEGNTYRSYATSSLPLRGNTDVVQVT